MDRASAYKKIEQIKWLIDHKTTGSPSQLAQRVEVSERTLYRLLTLIKETYGVEVSFSYLDNSYIIVSS
jgi:transcriptional antiterminator